MSEKDWKVWRLRRDLITDVDLWLELEKKYPQVFDECRLECEQCYQFTAWVSCREFCIADCVARKLIEIEEAGEK